MSHDADRVHEATPARLEQARREGEVPRSIELAGAVHMAGTILVALLFIGGIATTIQTWTQNYWSAVYLNQNAEPAADVAAITSEMQSTLLMFIAMIAPVLLLMFGASLLGHWGQTGMVLRPKNLSPAENVSGPVRWWNQLFSTRTVSLPILSVPKSLIAFGVAGVGCWFRAAEIMSLTSLPVGQMVSRMGNLILVIALQVAVAMLVLALIDYGIERWSFARRMRMTDQQLRDELRMQNGDPATTNRRREAHREIVRSRSV